MRLFSLLAVVAPVLLAACDSGPSPMMSTQLRAGAEKSVPVIRTLPRAAEQRYDPGVAPENEGKEMTVGGVVASTGGQKAQKEKDRMLQATLEAERARQRQELARQQITDAKISTQ